MLSLVIVHVFLVYCNAQGVVLLGNATINGSEIALTPSLANSVGAMFHPIPLHLRNQSNEVSNVTGFYAYFEYSHYVLC